MNTEQETLPVEVIDSSAISHLERAEIDMQIATARRYPRSLSAVKNRMLSYATLDEETAAGCFYTLPGRRGGDGKPIQGPSVRLAEIAISSFQNIRAGSRIIEDDGKFITAQGVVHDLENNVVISINVQRRVTKRDGGRFSDDMIATTGNAACSIALRNAAFRVIPLALVKPVYEAAKRLAVGDAKSIVQRRAASLDHFAKMGVSKEKVCECLGVGKPEDIQLDHLELLIGYANAIKDGDTSIDDVFTGSKYEPKARTEGNPFRSKEDKSQPEVKEVTVKEAKEIQGKNQDDYDQAMEVLAEGIAEMEITKDTFLARAEKGGWIEKGKSLADLSADEINVLAINREAIKGGKSK